MPIKVKTASSCNNDRHLALYAVDINVFEVGVFPTGCSSVFVVDVFLKPQSLELTLGTL